MANRYFVAGAPITGKIRVTAGTATGKKLQVELLKKPEGVKKWASVEIKDPATAPTTTGTEASYTFASDTILPKESRIGEVRIWLLVDGERYVHNSRRVFVYRTDMKIMAVDKDDAIVEDAKCTLSIAIDPEFTGAGVPFTAGVPNGAGGQSWTADTDDQGIARFAGLPVGPATIEWMKPHALGDRKWLVEGDYTKKGRKRKAEVWLAPTVHYVWAGNPTTANYILDATETPKAMADLDVDVHYWHQPVFTAPLGAKITAHPMASGSAILAGTGTWGNRLPALDLILTNLAQYRCFSAVKDLLSLCVLYMEGGFYFDTTTRIIGSRTDIFTKLVPNNDDEIRFVRTRTGGDYLFRANERSLTATFSAQMEGATTPGVVTSKNLDVWGIYAPEQHPAIETMIESYIDRAFEFGLYAYPSIVLMPSGKTVDVTMNQEDKASRNTIIAQLIATSVQEGMYKYAQAQGHPVTDYLWATAAPDDATAGIHHVSAVCDDLGIGKRHAGNWRNG